MSRGTPVPANPGTNAPPSRCDFRPSRPRTRIVPRPPTPLGSPKKFAHFSRKRPLCGAQRVRPQLFFQPTSCSTEGCAERRAPRRARVDGMRARRLRIFKTCLFSALSFRRCRSRDASLRAIVRTRRASARGCAHLVRGGGAKNSRRGELTAEKTVIRFRPTDVAAEASESAHSENAQQKNHLRPELLQGGCRHRLRCENRTIFFRTPAPLRIAGVFVLPGPRSPERVVPAVSVPVRLARRR